MTVQRLIDLLYTKAADLDEQGAHARAHELRSMVSDVRRAHAQVSGYRPPRRKR